MIWYLLYPFRGTTDPPQLAPDHPIRRAFTRYGTWTARNWLVSILLSVTIAVFLCYPVLFLYDTPAFAGGLARLPHHVWTSAKLVDGDDIRPDVEMRQVWVHGHYMKALETNVLREGLEIQNALVGENFGRVMSNQPKDGVDPQLFLPVDSPCEPHNGVDNSWGFHSPLLYWNCSVEAIESDKDILATINGQAHRRSFLNFTLRPPSVFAGKSFVNHKLQAADALVITLFDRLGYGIGEEWDRRAVALTERAPGRWTLYPEEGKVSRSQLFEFSFQPISIRDEISLAIAYTSMAVYVMISLRKLRAVKSRFGLVITVLSQIGISMLASITICGLLNINLTLLPQEAYPLVILVIGLENMFRLINAVLGKPAEIPTTARIASALGDVGHLSLAAAAQNLILLWVLSKFVWPGVAAFCAFAAVALVFDFVFHLTFFVAVLSVDVRRMELHESLAKVYLNDGELKDIRPSRQTWIDALLRNELPPSTRVAGSAILITFTLALNWHFDHTAFSFMRFLRYMQSGGRRQVGPQPVVPPINQARTPAAWLRMQDYDTAREVVRFVKPHAYNFVARVYDPLTIVLNGSDRRGASIKTPSVYRAFWNYLEAHFFPFTLAVVFAIAFVTVLMNYLLWDELPPEEPESDMESDLNVKHLAKSHSLDIVKLVACPKGHFVSVSVDRTISIWYCNPTTHKFTQTTIRTMVVMPEVWPIVAAAIDDSGTWLALCTTAGRIAFWSLPEAEFKRITTVDLGSNPPTALTFVEMDPEEPDKPSLVILTSTGVLIELDIIRSERPQNHELGHSIAPFVSVIPYPRGQPAFVSVSRWTGELLLTSKATGEWETRTIPIPQGDLLDDEFTKIKYIHSVPSLGLLILLRANELDIIESRSLQLVGTVKIESCKGSSLRVLHGPRRTCAICNGTAVHSLSFAYTSTNAQQCLVATYCANSDPSALICLRPTFESDEACIKIRDVKRSRYHIDHPGSWETTSIQAIIGVRRKRKTEERSYKNPANWGSRQSNTTSLQSNGTITHRSRTVRDRPSSSKPQASESTEWECWMFSTDGDFQSTPIRPPSSSSNTRSIHIDHLFVAKPGPITRLGRRSVVVALGNSVKVIMFGIEKFDDSADDYQMVMARRGTKAAKGRELHMRNGLVNKSR